MLDTEQARRLRDTMDIFTLVGMPDWALISLMTFTCPDPDGDEVWLVLERK